MTGQTNILSMLTLEKVRKRQTSKAEPGIHVMRNGEGRIKIIIHRAIAAQVPIESGDRVDVFFDKKNKMLVVDLNVDEGEFPTKISAASHVVVSFNGSDIPRDVVPETPPRWKDAYRLVERGATELVIIAPGNDEKKLFPAVDRKPAESKPYTGKKRGRPRKVGA